MIFSFDAELMTVEKLALSKLVSTMILNQKPPHWVQGIKYGGAKRDRTADLNTASVALSQLSYSPKIGGRMIGIRCYQVKLNKQSKATD
jgi:hypothetical protein